MKKFEMEQRVMVVNKNLTTHGLNGTVVDPCSHDKRVLVHLDNGRSANYNRDSLCALKDDYNGSPKTSMFFVFMHDTQNFYPTTIDEVYSFYDVVPKPNFVAFSIDDAVDSAKKSPKKYGFVVSGDTVITLPQS